MKGLTTALYSNMSQTSDVRKWYNEFSVRQQPIGVNIRHYTIMNRLIAAGLRRDSSVLEIGCGIGQLTSLMHQRIRKGHIVATDISDTAIELARQRLKDSASVEFHVDDMTAFVDERKFDFIVLPDVLEHIPLSQHRDLFGRLSSRMHEQSLICINIPHPRIQDYYRKYHPEKLQIIDQSLSALTLLEDAYAHGLSLVSYEPYRLFFDQPDYIFIKLTKHVGEPTRPRSIWEIRRSKLFSRLKYRFRTFKS